jgi:hypothetical protein
MAVPIALAIAGIASALGSAKMQADAQNQQAAMQGSAGAAGKGFGDFDKQTGTDKYMESIRSLNNPNPGNVYKQLDQENAPSLLQPGSSDHLSAGLATGGKPSGNVYDPGQSSNGGGGGGEGGGGFDMDNALQYAALAAQLGSMFAPPPPPAPPRGGGGMNINAQPFTMRMMGGR